jgi:hypothetical protein
MPHCAHTKEGGEEMNLSKFYKFWGTVYVVTTDA